MVRLHELAHSADCTLPHLTPPAHVAHVPDVGLGGSSDHPLLTWLTWGWPAHLTPALTWLTWFTSTAGPGAALAGSSV